MSRSPIRRAGAPATTAYGEPRDVSERMASGGDEDVRCQDALRPDADIAVHGASTLDRGAGSDGDLGTRLHLDLFREPAPGCDSDRASGGRIEQATPPDGGPASEGHDAVEPYRRRYPRSSECEYSAVPGASRQRVCDKPCHAWYRFDSFHAIAIVARYVAPARLSASHPTEATEAAADDPLRNHHAPTAPSAAAAVARRSLVSAPTMRRKLDQ